MVSTARHGQLFPILALNTIRMCNKHWMNGSLPQTSRFCLNLFSNMKLIHCICREFWLLKRSFSHWAKFWIPCNNLLVPVPNPFLQESFSKMRKKVLCPHQSKPLSLPFHHFSPRCFQVLLRPRPLIMLQFIQSFLNLGLKTVSTASQE